MRYHNITSDDMLNGDGLRVVLWVAGCNHCCKGCHNPVTWDPDGGLLFDNRAKQEIFAELDKSYISGITFSGGDPLHAANRLDVRGLMAEIREKYPGKTIWLYTGDSWENIYHYPIMKYIDVLVDGEFHEAEKDAKLLWKGSANQRVIDVQRTLVQKDPSVPVLHCGNYEQEYTLTAKPGNLRGCCD
ncbi:MAG: anaerobic ribonucleoside-triphosphate reductase activating protein [Lachnospiraceae bacterium]|jgi:anaerobic ribonucleoside-triphosphate reductase activating protein|nr:anaerobic ribonucleoside-triphosphate reductase activating protein [Lachnospiraceae bacterium]